MKNIFNWILVPAATIGLSACAAVIVDSYPSIPINYNEGDFELATPKGAIVTDVLGNPYSGQPGNFADRVRSLLRDQVGEFPVTFVSGPGANTTTPYKIIVVFNPPVNVSYRAICEDPKQTPVAAKGKGTLSVTMVFCDGQKLKAGTRGRVAGVNGANDPKFAALVQQVANSLIPPPGLQRQLNTSNDS